MKLIKSTLLFLVFHMSSLTWAGYESHIDIHLSAALQALLDKTHLQSTQSLDTMIDQTQTSWLRTGERWEPQDHQYEPLKKDLWPYFSRLGHVDQWRPKQKRYDAVLILGASSHTYCRRFQYVLDLWRQGIRFSHLYHLVGEAPAFPKGYPKSTKTLFSIPLKPGWQEKLKGGSLKTETDLARFLMIAVPLSKGMSLIPVTYVDTLTKNKKRPNTADTIRDWVTYLPQDRTEPYTILVISNQPYIPYQEMVFLNVLHEKGLSHIQVDFAGPAINPTTSARIVLDTLARRLWEVRKARSHSEHKKPLGLMAKGRKL